MIRPRLCIQPIANDTVCTLYCSDPRIPHSVIGATPSLSPEEILLLPPPRFPTYRTPAPRCNIFMNNKYYSEASLEGLVRVQLCMDAKYCIGILLHYKIYSKTVGQFRYDKDISEFLDPGSFGLVQEQHRTNPRIRIQLLDEHSDEETKRQYLCLTKGSIVWWYSKDVSSVTLFPL